MKTPLGMAMREAVGEAAGYILGKTREVSWMGQVVDVQNQSFYLNAGLSAGLKVGDKLRVSTVARDLIDPATGASLGRIEQALGEARIDRGQVLGGDDHRRLSAAPGDLVPM